MIVTLGPVQERAWLIGLSTTPLYWSATTGWGDTLSATRFAREQDAREVAAFAGLTRTCAAVEIREHVWAEAGAVDARPGKRRKSA